MAGYIEYIKVGTGESWPVRDKDAQDKLANIVDLVYPVGSIYMSTNAVSPAELFGGTWTAIQDTFLLAAGSTYAAGTTGGEATHTLTEAEMPSHHHRVNQQELHILEGDLNFANYGASGPHGGWGIREADANNQGSYRLGIPGHDTNETGGGLPHNNMPPYLAVHMWQRIE